MAVISDLLDFSTSTAVLSFFLAAFYAIPTIRQYFLRRKIIQERGCQPPPSIPCRDLIFGLDTANNLKTVYKKHQRSENFKKWHDTYGQTYQSMALRKTRIYTINSDNLRAMFSNIEDWAVQPLRLPP